PRAHPLPALPLRAAFERCGDGSCRREAARRSGGFDEDADLIATPDLAALRVPVGGSVEGVGEIGLAAELRVPARGGDAEWNAVDATAQEGSDGRYPMGPDDADGDGVPDGRRTWVEQEARSAAPRVLAEAPMGTVGATVAALGAPEGGRLDVLANGRLQWSIARADDAPGAAPALPLEAGELLRGLPTPLGRATFLVETRQIEDGAVFRQVVRRSGDRVERGRRDPSVWFYPGSTRLRAIGPCGDGCPDGQEVSWVDEEGVLQLGRIDPGSVAVALAGEGPLALVEGSTVALGAAPTGADLGLDVLPGTLAETTRPQRVSTWALPFATDPEDPPAPPGRPVREELVAVHAWDTGTACPLALLLYPDGDATAEPEVLSTSDAEDCGGLELPVATSNGGGALGVFVFAPSSVGAAAMLVTGPWAGDARTEVSLSIWGRQPTQSDPEPRVRRRPDLLQAEWDELIDESVEMLRENPLQGMAVGDVDGDGLDDVWQDRAWLESGRPTLRLGGGPAGGLREERAAPPVRRFKGRGPIQLTGRTN
ncbi:MAG TPA: hypothetical protein RMH80_25665, partial [Polyangiaceae bacterium LLY-WYZ-15_(1-7)]|nr:hypothetical protein [Polyangiaceae bacterium LLY-WYZ-15_(1-7)]